MAAVPIKPEYGPDARTPALAALARRLAAARAASCASPASALLALLVGARR